MLKNLANWFNGKKTIIGGYISSFLVLCDSVGLDIPDTPEKILKIAAGLLLIGGTGHKIGKVASKTIGIK